MQHADEGFACLICGMSVAAGITLGCELAHLLRRIDVLLTHARPPTHRLFAHSRPPPNSPESHNTRIPRDRTATCPAVKASSTTNVERFISPPHVVFARQRSKKIVPHFDQI